MAHVARQDLTMFAQVNANHPRLLEWLQAERAEAIKTMTMHRDPVVIHRTQGDVARLNNLIELLVNANKHLVTLKIS